MGAFSEFVRSRVFYKHLFIMFLLTSFLIWGTLKILDVYTMHDKYVTVPDFTGLSIKDLDKFTTENKLRYVIIDSIYDSKKQKGTVVAQTPLPKSNVKINRRIYLTVVSLLPEMVTVPNLVDLTMRQAVSRLETYGLKAGNIEYVPSEYANAVLQQRYKGRAISQKILEEGSLKVEKGSVIGLVIGEGLNSQKTLVPFLYGMTREEAESKIFSISLNIGMEAFENCRTSEDSSKARVFRQNPGVSSGAYLRLGSAVDLWYKLPREFNFDSLVKAKARDTVNLNKDTVITE